MVKKSYISNINRNYFGKTNIYSINRYIDSSIQVFEDLMLSNES